MNRENWDDLRYVLAVAEAGSVSGAARKLGVNHATVLRRIAGFEERHGGELFNRTATGYQIPPDKLRVIDAAREVMNAVETVDRLLKGATTEVSGVVRVTSTDSLCQFLLPDVVAGIMADAPGLRIELYSTNAHLDLSRLHADISVRPTQKLPDDLVGEPAGRLDFATYAPRGLPDAAWLGMRGPLGRSAIADWVIARSGDAVSGAGADSFPVLRELVARGLGRSVLPVCVGQGDARIEQVDPAPDPMSVPIWVASHADLADVPRLRVLRMKLAQALRDKTT